MKKILFVFSLLAIMLPLFAQGENSMKSSDVRLQNFMAKIRRGENVTVIALGGSITTGYNSKNPAKDGWAGLTGEWLKNLAKENGSTLSFYNQGCSGTDSAFAIARLNDHVLKYKPDLILLEFAMNDQWLEAKVRERTYESIIRSVMDNTDTAILVLFVNERKSPYSSAQAVQQPICEHYQIPFVSWKDDLESKGKLGDFEKYFDGEETVHPNNAGHAYIASLLESKLDSVWKNLPADASISAVEKVLPAVMTDTGFTKAKYYGADNIKPVSNKGWKEGSPVHNEWLDHGNSHQGWQTNNVDAEIVFEVEGSSVGVTYCESDQFRNAQAWVVKADGTVGPKVNLMCYQSFRKGYYGWAYKELVNDAQVQKYEVHIGVSKRAAKNSEGKPCNITGILVADCPAASN